MEKKKKKAARPLHVEVRISKSLTVSQHHRIITIHNSETHVIIKKVKLHSASFD